LQSGEKKEKEQRRSPFTLNIGIILFGAILVYIIICIFIYATTTHISTCQVTAGPLARNQTYTAIAVRSETLITANNEGYVNYYALEGRKVRKAGAVYSLSQTPPKTTGETKLSEESLNGVRSLVAQFANSFDPAHFNDVYAFKYALSGSILNYAGLEGGSSTAMLSGQGTVYQSPENGVIVYSEDGYENVTEQSVTSADFDRSSYQYRNLKTAEKVTAGAPVYKLIDNDTWSILIQLTSSQASRLEGRESIKVKFLKDDSSMNGELKLLTKSDGIYAMITFSSGMIRFVTERFLDIELVTNSETGLKIPVSSVVSKDFYLISKKFAVNVENSSDIGFLKRVTDKDGNTSTEFINATIYESDEEYYYVDTQEFADGDVLLMENSNQTFTVKDIAQLEGVYCVNKGYAVFRKIEIIDQNEEYCIVATGTSYGLSLYDNIVLDSNTVQEDEILF
jgi:hypothetical protein